jgi:hypothetical protein
MRKEHGTRSGQKRERLEINPSQVAAGALAAITAAVLGAKLGVAGTVVGAGMASVVGTVGASVYQHSIERTRDRVRARVGQPKDDEAPAEAVLLSHDAETVRLTVPPPPDEPSEAAKRRWPMVALAAVVAFVLGIGTLTGIELIKGSAVSGGDNRTTIGSVFAPHGQSTTTRPSQTTTTTPSPTTSPTSPPSSTTPTTTTGPTTTTTPTSTTTVNGTSTSASTPPGAG